MEMFKMRVNKNIFKKNNKHEWFWYLKGVKTISFLSGSSSVLAELFMVKNKALWLLFIRLWVFFRSRGPYKDPAML